MNILNELIGKHEKNGKLNGKKVAILATNGFEQSELFEPKEMLEAEGAKVDVISQKTGDIKAWKEQDWGKKIKVDKTIQEANISEYDALLLPGGVLNPDQLRIDVHAVQFVKDFHTTNKPIAAICHGPQLLIDCDAVKGQKLTSYPSIKQDLINAGANWENHEVVQDKTLITSRTPKDIKVFVNTLITTICNEPLLNTTVKQKDTQTQIQEQPELATIT